MEQLDITLPWDRNRPYTIGDLAELLKQLPQDGELAIGYEGTHGPLISIYQHDNKIVIATW